MFCKGFIAFMEVAVDISFFHGDFKAFFFLLFSFSLPLKIYSLLSFMGLLMFPLTTISSLENPREVFDHII